MEASNNWPRPSEIPWQTQVANSVNLIGRVQIPVQFQASPDGKYWAGTIISQQDEEGTIFSSDSPPFWIPIIFEGDLAHIAACHLKEKDCVYIAGQLSADPPPFTISQGQANVQVMVRSINFVQGSSQLKKSFAPCKQEKLVKNHPASVTKEGGYWMDLLKNPKQWWDHRENKLNRLVNPKHPDFKHKDSGDALWLDRAPKWVLSELEGLEFDVQLRKTKQVMDKKEDDSWKNLVENPKDDSWKNLVENPSKWWDNRLGKVNVKSPDFKHKDTGEALWLNDSPAWVLSRLPPLKTKENLAPGKWKLRS
ncbi:hypothetical protein F0562_030706 [Nyssa sinensis]|uniref:Uncharacterized protein n=1 Tax=Nyssa sinensis TaxID=561372 RepID=A0A5J5AXL9_9ASTE|nr:hypothetical protein F0562_030706 [Nyssa sinensis]